MTSMDGAARFVMTASQVGAYLRERAEYFRKSVGALEYFGCSVHATGGLRSLSTTYGRVMDHIERDSPNLPTLVQFIESQIATEETNAVHSTLEEVVRSQFAVMAYSDTLEFIANNNPRILPTDLVDFTLFLIQCEMKGDPRADTPSTFSFHKEAAK